MPKKCSWSFKSVLLCHKYLIHFFLAPAVFHVTVVSHLSVLQSDSESFLMNSLKMHPASTQTLKQTPSFQIQHHRRAGCSSLRPPYRMSHVVNSRPPWPFCTVCKLPAKLPKLHLWLRVAVEGNGTFLCLCISKLEKE